MLPEEDGELPDCMVMCGEKVGVKVVKRCSPEMVGDPNPNPNPNSNPNPNWRCSPEMAGGLSFTCEDRRDCFCEPTMCLSCMAKWFGESDHTSCPTCRIKFCMHDVVPVTLDLGQDTIDS